MKEPKEMTNQELMGVVGESIGVDLTPEIKQRLISCLKELESRGYHIAFNKGQLLIVAPETLDIE